MTDREETPARLERCRILRRSADPSSTLALIDLADDADETVRCQAILALGGRRDERALPLVTRLLSADPSARIRYICATALGFFSNPSVRHDLELALDDPSNRVVENAIASLCSRGDSDSVPRLHRFLKSNEWSLRYSACESLILLNSVDGEVVQVLQRLMDAPESLAYEESMSNMHAVLYAWIKSQSPYADGYPAPLTLAELLDKARVLALRSEPEAGA